MINGQLKKLSRIHQSVCLPSREGQTRHVASEEVPSSAGPHHEHPPIRPLRGIQTTDCPPRAVTSHIHDTLESVAKGIKCISLLHWSRQSNHGARKG